MKWKNWIDFRPTKYCGVKEMSGDCVSVEKKVLSPGIFIFSVGETRESGDSLDKIRGKNIIEYSGIIP